MHGWVVVGAIALAGCGPTTIQWAEEVRLQDGQMIRVERTAQGRTFSELGGMGGWKDPVNMSVSITRAPDGIKPPPEWRDGYVAMLLDYDAPAKSWSMVATYYYCETWYALGRPIPPYIEYQSVQGSPWKRVPLEERLIGREANLLTGPRTDGEPDLVTIADKEFRERSSGRMYQLVLRKWGRAEANFCDLS